MRLSSSSAASMRGVRAALALAQQLVRHAQPPHLLLLSAASAHATATALASVHMGCAHGGMAGLAWVVRLEHAASAVLHADVADHGRQQGRALRGVLLEARGAGGGASEDAEVAWEKKMRKEEEKDQKRC